MDETILELLRHAPRRWTPLESDTLTADQEQALKLLTAAGLIERRFAIRLSLIGHPTRLKVTATATGEHGIAEAMAPVLQKAWDLWSEFYRDGEAGPPEERPRFFCEKTAPESWRLSQQGALALADLEAGEQQRVLDFVHRRPPVFAGRVVPGEGRAERIEQTDEKQTQSAPSQVEVTNLSELSEPLQQMQTLMQRMFEQMAANERRQAGAGSTANSAPSASHEPTPAKPAKRGPARLPLEQAWRYLTIVQEWEGIQEQNKKRPLRDRYQKVQLAEKHGIKVKDLDAMLSWYRKNRRAGLFPEDPRTMSKGELEESFE